jgi:hypothetical protein
MTSGFSSTSITFWALALKSSNVARTDSLFSTNSIETEKIELKMLYWQQGGEDGVYFTVRGLLGFVKCLVNVEYKVYHVGVFKQLILGLEQVISIINLAI